MTECMQDHDFGDTFLGCCLPAGHDLPHYDADHDLSWQEGKPDD